MLGKRAIKLHSLSEKTREALGGRPKVFVRPVIVGVSGGHASGKSTFCRELVLMLGSETVLFLSQERYHREPSRAGTTPEDNWILSHETPDEVEFPLLQHHLDELSVGSSVLVPDCDLRTRRRLAAWQLALPKPIIIVEGSLLFSDAETTAKFNHKIFIDTPSEVRVTRSIQKEVREHGREAHLVESMLRGRVLPAHEQFVEPKKGLADIVVPGEGPFEPYLVELCASLFEQMLSRKKY